MNGAPPIDVVVVSYNRRDLLLACCRRALEAGAAQLIVVDNASEDGSAAAVAEAFPEAVLLEGESNRGFAAAVNHGMARSSASLVLLLNPDATVSRSALETLRAGVLEAPDVAAAGPRIRDPRGRLELSVGRTMSPLNEAWFKIQQRLYDRDGTLARWIERRYEHRRPVSSLSAACLLLRRAAVDQVGGLDERFFLYAEDVDLCLRLRRAGWRLLYVPAAEVRHERGASRHSDPAAAERAWRGSQLAFYCKHRSPLMTLLLRAYVAGRRPRRQAAGLPEDHRPGARPPRQPPRGER